MSLSILNNISALTAENSMSTTQANLQKTLTQLSTGMKINSGADDAAGLSIANGMVANIAALTQSGQNATNAIGLLQTSDGALSQVTSLLNRATTLATEASSNGLSASQSGALSTEFSAILNSIDNIGKNTNFNGASVFTSSPITPFLGDGTSGNNLLGGTAINVGRLSTSGLSIAAGTAATGTLTSASQAIAGNSVTIGGATYTFQAVASPAAAGKVTIGASITATMAALAAAVNGTDGANGANANVTASNPTATTLSFTATTNGLAGNAIVSTATFGAFGGGTLAGGLATGGVDLSTPTGAQSALVAITTAINTVSQLRGSLGASINQLAAASNVMTSQVLNLQSADNGIMNADIGKTVANMTQYNILQSTGMSALQQANQSQQAILKLLQ